jgi:hypothetical protein
MKKYYKINNDKMDSSVKHCGFIGLAIYAALCRIGSDLGEASSFSVSMKVVSFYSGIGVRTLHRYLPKLKKAGIIDIESGVNPSGNCENTYKLEF